MIALAFDTETTGLIQNRSLADRHQPEVVELYFGLVDLADGGRVVEELDSLVKPRQPIDEDGKAFSVHKITNAMVASAPSFQSLMPRVKAMIEAAPCVIGHNVTFDQEVIDIEAARCGASVAWPRLICTVEQTMHVKGHRLNLSALHEFLLGQPFPGAHRAKADVAALVRCLVKMREMEMI